MLIVVGRIIAGEKPDIAGLRKPESPNAPVYNLQLVFKGPTGARLSRTLRVILDHSSLWIFSLDGRQFLRLKASHSVNCIQPNRYREQLLGLLANKTGQRTKSQITIQNAQR